MRQAGLVDQRDGCRDHLVEIVRRDVGSHAHRDAGRTVHQQVRHARRQHQWFVLALVVVRAEVDGFLVDVGQQLVAEPRHAHLGIAHGSGAVAVDRAEVALAVDQHVAQRERLRHAHDRVVNRLVAMRMVFTDDVTDHAGRLLVRLVVYVAQLVHREQHAPMHGFQTITHIRQGAPHDHAHGVIEIALAHLVFDIDANDFFGEFCHESASLNDEKRALAPRLKRMRERPEINPVSVPRPALKRQDFIFKNQ